MKNKINYVLLLAVLLPIAGWSQINLREPAEEFWSSVRSAAPYVFAAVLLVSVMFNIGKVTGENRDYKGFFTGVGLFMGALVLVGLLITWILSLTF